MAELEEVLDRLTPEQRKLFLERLDRRHRERAAAPGEPPLARRDTTGPAPLSLAQERLWFLEELTPGTGAFNIPVVVRLTGTPDLPALRGGLHRIVERHESLRTAFVADAGKPQQAVTEVDAVELPVVDLGALPATAREAQARELAAVETLRPFELTKPALPRLLLLALGPRDHVLVLTLHHLVADGWSRSILFQELVTLYRGLGEGRFVHLPELPVQYADFAVWQRRWLAGEVLERQLGYWSEQLRDAPQSLPLPTDRPRPAVWSYRGRRRKTSFPRQLTQDLKALGRREDATLFMVLLAVFAHLLLRYTGSRDLVVGSPIAGRSRAELEPLIGFFVNTLALRVRLSEETSFRQLLRQVRETTLGAFAHQELPFARLVQALRPERQLSHSPLFQVMLVLQNPPAAAVELPDLTLSPAETPRETAMLELHLSVTEMEQTLAVELEYSTDLFDATTAGRLLAHFTRLAAAVAADPGEPLARYPLLSAGERQQLRHEWNDTAVAVPARGDTIPERFRKQAEATPDAVALAFGDETLTYGELDRRARQLAHHLRGLGVGPEVRVGICMERSLELMVALYATLAAGGAYVPVDPTYPVERVRLMLEDARPRVVLTQERFRELVTHGGGETEALCPDRETYGPPDGGPGFAPDPDSLAYVIFTSGSTGRPKGSMNTHRAIHNRLRWMQDTYRLGPQDQVLQKTPISFDVSVWELFWPLVEGARLVIAESGGHQDPVYLVRTIQRTGITTVHFVPSMLAAFLEAPGVGECRGLRRVICSGEALPSELVERFHDLLPEVELHNLYGPTEAAVDVTLWRCEAGKSRSPTPIGRPISNTRISVLDRRLQLLPAGVPGELLIGGVQVCRGYLGRPALTAERFVPDPGSEAGPGARTYRTGDLVRHLADGTIEFLGRIDHQVKIRGFRIELGEVEACLERHPAVSQAVVVTARGTGVGEYLAGYVVTRGPDATSVAELRGFLDAALPSYMVPAAFVFLDAFPLTPSGKVDRRALPSPEGERPAPNEDRTAPRSPSEQMLAGIWEEVLGQPEVGAHDDFFALGGHSLLATQVFARIREVFSVELPLRTLFEASTLSGLAARIDTARREDQGLQTPPLTASPRPQELPLSFAQERLWFLEQLDPGTPRYSVSGAVDLSGALDVGRLAGSLSEIVRRHESLRTSFTEHRGVAAQVVAPSSRRPLPVVDLEELAAPEAEARRLARRLARKPFDLRHGPLLRVVLLRLTATEHRAVFVLHHIVSDAWSFGLLSRELGALYAGEKLPPLAVQYADFALWQRRWLLDAEDAATSRQLAWWRRHLEGVSGGLTLPTDRPRPPMQGVHGASVPIRFPTELLADLETLARGRKATLFMVLMAGFDFLLHRYTGEPEVVVGTTVAGRGRKEVEGLIGFFVNTLALAARLRAEESFEQLLDRVRTSTLEAYERQDLPFEKLVAELEVESDLSRSPLFQVMLTLLNTPRPELELPELTLRGVRVDAGTSRFDLDLQVWAAPEGLVGSCVYDLNLYDATTVVRFLGHYRRLLESLRDAAGRPLGDLPWLTAAEEHQLLTEWNDTRGTPPSPRLLPELVAAQDPRATALVFGEERWSYGELNRRADRLAHHLRGLGVGPDTRVGILMERSPEMVASLLAVLRAGGAYLPVDPAAPEARKSFVLADAGARVVVADEASAESLPEFPGEVVVPGRLPRDGEAPATVATTTADASPERLAYVLYTSGSTGQPKGVMVSHRQLSVYLTWALSAYPVAGRVLVHSPVTFDLTVTGLLAPLQAGGTVFLLGPEAGLDELAASLRGGFDLTLLKLTPAHLEGLNRLLTPAEKAGAVQALILGGEALEYPSLRPWRRHAPATRLINEYGPTETVVGCAVHEVTGDVPVTGTVSVPIGRPIPEARLYVLSRDLRPLPAGAVGELGIGGPAVTRGYLNRPRLTAERFVPDPFATESVGARTFKSGDLARRRADGELEFLGRLDHQVKLRGFRIEPGEIEATLTRHPAVEQAVVLLKEQGGGDQRLVAFLVVSPQQAPDDGELRRLLAAHLPDYMSPSAFVRLDGVPLTPTGKVDRRALLALEVPGEPAEAWTAPRTPLEEVVARIWSEVLGVERIGVDDHFSRLGGHSLLATQVVSRVREALRVELPIRTLFEAPTVAGMARAVEARRREAGTLPAPPPLTASPGQERPPLSFAQQRLWVIDQLEGGGSHAYNVPLALRVDGRLDPEALEWSLNEVVRRQESLRTSFAVEGTRPCQAVAPFQPRKLPVVDLRGLPAEEARRETRRRTEEEARRPFDLATGPLLRQTLIRLGDEGWVFLMTLHHIVSDGWSMGILLDEVTTLYQARRAGRPSPLPELGLQYRDFAVWQRRWLRGEVLRAQLAHWREHLDGMPKALDLPLDHPRGAERGFHGGRCHLTLPAELADALRTLAQENEATLFIVLLATFQVLLSRYSGQEDVVVGTLVANRNRPEIERLVGFFANTLVLRTDLSGPLTFQQLLARVREVVFDAWSHQDLPFEVLVKELRPERTLGENPLFRVMFAVDNAPFSVRELPELTFSRYDSDPPVSHFDLSFHLWEDAREIRGWMAYSTELFETATVERMLGHFATLLRGVVADPAAPLSRLSLVGEDERRRLQEVTSTPAAGAGKLPASLRDRLRRTIQTAQQRKGGPR